MSRKQTMSRNPPIITKCRLQPTERLSRNTFYKYSTLSRGCKRLSFSEFRVKVVTVTETAEPGNRVNFDSLEGERKKTAFPCILFRTLPEYLVTNAFTRSKGSLDKIFSIGAMLCDIKWRPSLHYKLEWFLLRSSVT
jgi:hypothetical protein